MKNENLTIKNYLQITKIIIISGTLLRFIFSPFTGHPYDLPIWMESGELIANGISPYSPYNHLGQTILWALWTGISYVISSQIQIGEPYLYIFLIKLLPIFADIGVCYLTIQILQDKTGLLSVKKIKIYTALIYFNPVFIFASSFWAMVDSLALFFILLAFREIRSGNYFRSALSLSIAIALKLYPVILLPPFLLYMIVYHNDLKKSIIYGLYVTTSFLFIAYIPLLFFSWPTRVVTNVLFDQTNRKFGGMTPLGFLAVADHGSFSEDLSWIYSTFSRYIIIRLMWVIVLFIFTLIILFLHYKSRYSLLIDDFSGLLYLSLSFYSIWIVFASWVSEQNFVPLIGLSYLLLFYMIETEKPFTQIRNFLVIITILVTCHIIVNVPFIMFFYLLQDEFNIEFDSSVKFRETYLAIFIIGSTATLIRYFMNILTIMFERINDISDEITI